MSTPSTPIKSTAAMMQLATADGASRQQMIVFPSKAVYRRSLTDATRTRWRHASVADLPTWVDGYVTLTASSPTPMTMSHWPVLMEVTEDEATEAEGGSFPRNVGLRFARVLDALDADPSSVIPFTGSVKEYMDAWVDALARDDNAWIDTHIHAAGTAKAPAAAATAAPDPEPEPVVVPVSVGSWVYPETVKGYITVPNGTRYKVRTLDGTPDVQVLREARPDREHSFLYGEPGTGKTVLVEAAFGSDLVTMLGTEDTEVSDFIGGYTVRGGGSYGWTDGALVEAMERGVPLFIDEVGVIAPKVMTVAFSVMDGRDEIRVTANPDRGTVRAEPGFFVIGATNPHAPGVRLSEALLSRFAIHMEVGTDYSVCRELGVPDALVTAADNLNTRRATGEIGWAPQMRELLRASAQWTKRGDLFAVRNLISSAPEDDRDVVAEVLARTTGHKVTGLAL
jgi:nitric oxide reductase NorQ protein